MTARHRCPIHGPTLFRVCPSCQAIAHPPQTPRETRKAINSRARHAREARSERKRQEALKPFWGQA